MTFFCMNNVLCIFNGLRRAVPKVGDCFGTDSSGEPFERTAIVFLNGLLELLEEMTIFSELVHNVQV